MKRKIHIVTFERILGENKYRIFLKSELEKGYSLKVHVKGLDNDLTDLRYDCFFLTIGEVILFLEDYNVELTIDSLLLGIKRKVAGEYGFTGRSKVDWEAYTIQMAVLIRNGTVKFNKSTGLFELNRTHTKEQVW